MNAKLKTTIWAMTLFFSIASLLVISSCSDDNGDDPDPDPAIPPSFSYTDTSVPIGATSEVIPALQGDLPILWTITDAGDAADFVSIDAATGTLSVGAESVIGEYEIAVNAKNTGGESDGTAKITITVNDLFNPIGKTLIWRFVMNQDENLTFTGLDGELVGPALEELLGQAPPPTLQSPVGWPDGLTPPEQYWTYFLLTEVHNLILQVPGDEACTAAGGSGDTLTFVVNEDLTLSAACTDVDPAQIGTSNITYENGAFSFEMLLEFDPASGLSVPIKIDGAGFADFDDVFSVPGSVRTYPALQGRVNGFTTPTDLTSEETARDITKWAVPVVDVILEVLE